MSGSKGIKTKKPDADKPFNEAEALKKIDMSAITPEGILSMIKKIGYLEAENRQLKEDALKPHFPSEMSVNAYNWCVDMMQEHFNSFGKAKPVPAMIDPNAPKIIAMGEGGQA